MPYSVLALNHALFQALVPLNAPQPLDRAGLSPAALFWQEALMRYFEDLNPGDVFELGELSLTEEEIVDFASRFDPQPFHVDKEAAARSIFGGIIASGWHTGSAFMGLLVRSLLHDVAGLGSGGLDEMRWLKTGRPGEE